VLLPIIFKGSDPEWKKSFCLLHFSIIETRLEPPHFKNRLMSVLSNSSNQQHFVEHESFSLKQGDRLADFLQWSTFFANAQ
jgi:hypothetical protein